LNQNDFILSHNGSGTISQYNDANYFLIDKVFNAITHIYRVNQNLSKTLRTVYETNKRQWTEIPKTFENACSLARQAHILTQEISRLYSVNANMTPWADW
jgi:hypothetical protein